MKTKVRNTSREAYREIEAEGLTGTQKRQIYLCLETVDKPLSRREISKYLGLETSSVAARVNAMIEDGHLEEIPKAMPCPITGRLVHHVRIRDKAKRKANVKVPQRKNKKEYRK